MKNTPEQDALFRWVDKSDGNGLLISVAGSGKTTSIIQSLNYIDDTEPVIVCSFTKLVATELEKRVKAEKFENVTSTTLNSLGWGLCKANVPGVKLDQHKTLNILRYHLSKMPIEPEFQKKVQKAIGGTVKKMVGLLKSYVVRDNLDDWIQKLMKLHDVEMPEGDSEQVLYGRQNFNTLVKMTYTTSVEFMQEMDFDDQKFMPVYYGWSGQAPRFIIVDECQDCNECDIQLVGLMMGLYKSQPTRSLWVGDPRQSIYGFRGSLPDACDQIKERFNCHEMSLTVCWRCPDAVLRMAQDIVPAIRGPEPNPRGEGVVQDITTADFKETVRVGDYVICRTTAPLVKRCLELVQKNVPALVKGKDVGRSILDLIEVINARLLHVSSNDGADYLKNFIQELKLYQSEQVQMLEAAGREEQAIAISDKCDALEVFCLDSNSINEVGRRIENLFQDDMDEDKVVLFMTGHKAKGLQRKRVWFLRPDLCPHPRAKSATQEENLRYVIITRSEAELFFVLKEKDEK